MIKLIAILLCLFSLNTYSQQKEIASRYLNLLGTAYDTTYNMNYDLSDSDQDTIKLTPGTNEVYYLHSLTVSIETADTLTIDGYGDGAALDSGILVQIFKRGVLNYNLTFNDTIFYNTSYKNLGFNELFSYYGRDIMSGDNNHVSYKLILNEPVILDGGNSDRLYIILNDDFSGLTKHVFFAEFTKLVYL
jgi:hypothetical protein